MAQRHEATEEQQVLRRKATMRSAEAAETGDVEMGAVEQAAPELFEQVLPFGAELVIWEFSASCDGGIQQL